MRTLNRYFITVLKKHYADFAGRATRKQFWMFMLFVFIVKLAVRILAFFVGGKIGAALSVLATLAFLLPMLAIAARRLHDTNRSAYWLLAALFPTAFLSLANLLLVPFVFTQEHFMTVLEPYMMPLGLFAFLNAMGGVVLFVFYLLPSEK